MFREEHLEAGVGQMIYVIARREISLLTREQRYDTDGWIRRMIGVPRDARIQQRWEDPITANVHLLIEHPEIVDMRSPLRALLKYPNGEP